MLIKSSDRKSCYRKMGHRKMFRNWRIRKYEKKIKKRCGKFKGIYMRVTVKSYNRGTNIRYKMSVRFQNEHDLIFQYNTAFAQKLQSSLQT